MLLSSLLFVVYTAVFLFILYRLSLKKTFDLSFKSASLAFIAKVVAGCVYGYFFLHYYGGDDTWKYHNEGLKELALLKTNPLQFLSNGLLPEGYDTNQLSTIFDSTHSFVKDLELTLLFKLLAVFDFFSGGNYYVNVIFYNMIVFSGSYVLYKMFCTKYPEKKTLWMLVVFYLPATLFWTSGIRKDGLCFAIICGLLYQLFVLFEKEASVKRIILAVLLFVLLFLFRNYLALPFIPVVIGYFFYRRKKKYAIAVFSCILIVGTCLFFLSSVVSSHYNLPLKMAERQQAFLELKGGSYLPIDTLQGNLISYYKILPAALNHVFVRPYMREAGNLLYLFSFLNSILFFVIMMRIFIKPEKDCLKIFNTPFILSLLTIALLNYIIIGYTVPFLGAIVRYKASFEIFFILSFLALQQAPLFLFKKRNLIIAQH
ncbi:MAG: hypothetical protein JST21_14630 [Bacteroidetes bacterium]|nr:hypothetical protein [Bacteroidota bacterium]